VILSLEISSVVGDLNRCL